MSDKLTKPQQDALETITKAFGHNWFGYPDILSVAGILTIKRPRYVCDTLHEKGYLERELNPNNNNPYTETFFLYRVPEKTKEQIYDEEINPLMAQILEICKRHKIPMLATFSTPSEDDPGLLVTSFLLDPEWGTPSEFAEAAIVIKPPTVFMAFTVTK